MSYSRDPKIDKYLRTWEPDNLKKNGMVLVHTFNVAKFNHSDFNIRPAERVFEGWDVISTSLANLVDTCSLEFDLDHRLAITSKMRKNTEKCNKKFYEMGLLLQVPPQNILGTHEHDVWFPNHIGSDRNSAPRGTPKNRKFLENGYKLADAIFSGKSKDGRHDVAGGYNKIVPAKDIINSKLDTYNEILVVGRPGVSMHFKPTGNIKVLGAFYDPKRSPTSQELARVGTVFGTLKRNNPGIRFFGYKF